MKKTNISMRQQRTSVVPAGLALALLAAAAPRPNVLLIYVDDLRVSDDGTEVMPHQDALAARGVSFTQARAMYPMCGPSRNALLSGRRQVRHESVVAASAHGALLRLAGHLGGAFAAPGAPTPTATCGACWATPSSPCRKPSARRTTLLCP